MFKLILVFLVSLSSVVFAGEIFTKDAEQFKATVSFENGKDAKIILKASPKKGWHINDDFPISFKPKSTCLLFDKKKYKKKDAKVFKETELLFEIPTKYNKDGKQTLEATVTLGVCTEAICKRVQFKINASLESKINPKAKPKNKKVSK